MRKDSWFRSTLLGVLTFVLVLGGTSSTGAADFTSDVGAYIGNEHSAELALAGGIIGGAAGLFFGAYLGSIIAPGPGTIVGGLKGGDVGAGLGAIIGGA
ncbi:MAG: hypothetical protein OXU63_03885 [Acidobacteriota bacterium]|nr:hypothetical protein [Acidobacteriota bacterium]